MQESIFFGKSPHFRGLFLFLEWFLRGMMENNIKTKPMKKVLNASLGVICIISGMSSFLFLIGTFFSVTHNAEIRNLICFAILAVVSIATHPFLKKAEKDEIAKQQNKELESSLKWREYVNSSLKWREYVNSHNNKIMKEYNEFTNEDKVTIGAKIDDVRKLHFVSPSIQTLKSIGKNGICPTCGAALNNGVCSYCGNSTISKDADVRLVYNLTFGTKSYEFHDGKLTKIETSAKPLSNFLLIP